jgi:hypothetical protein
MEWMEAGIQGAQGKDPAELVISQCPAPVLVPVWRGCVREELALASRADLLL